MLICSERNYASYRKTLKENKNLPFLFPKEYYLQIIAKIYSFKRYENSTNSTKIERFEKENCLEKKNSLREMFDYVFSLRH